jgi:hypothetical protein
LLFRLNSEIEDESKLRNLGSQARKAKAGALAYLEGPKAGAFVYLGGAKAGAFAYLGGAKAGAFA